jgi:hypothetical protein
MDVEKAVEVGWVENKVVSKIARSWLRKTF